MRAVLLVLGTIAGVSACRGDAPVAPAPPEAGEGRATVEPAVKVDAALAAAPAREASQTWHGSYQSQAGTLYIPDDWKGVHWKVAESASGLGEGLIRLSLDSEGRVRGAVEGPLGPAVLAGFAAGGALTASVRPEPSADSGFAGTLTGRIVDGRVDGTIHLSSAIVDAVRVATFVLGTDGAPSH